MSALARFRDARDGVTAIEFGIMAPVFCLFLVGGFDVAHTLYMQTAVQGVMQKVARDAALESGANAPAQQALDDKVIAQVRAIANNSTITFRRRFYRTFSEASAAQAEPYSDTNGNGTCDGPIGATPGEPYDDTNNNNTWDDDGGNGGQGGARDRTLYTVRVTYPRMLPLDGFIGIPDTVTITASTVLANQPYADQNSYGPPVAKNCT